MSIQTIPDRTLLTMAFKQFLHKIADEMTEAHVFSILNEPETESLMYLVRRMAKIQEREQKAILAQTKEVSHEKAQ